MIFKFNTAKAISYAYSYIKKPNPFYKVFDGEKEGVNFISQCIMAGCENLNSKSCPDWFYENEKSHSESWANYEDLYKYILNQNQCGVIGRLINEALISVGDIVFFELEDGVRGVALVSKICEDEIFVVEKVRSFCETSLEKFNFKEAKIVHIIGVKK